MPGAGGLSGSEYGSDAYTNAMRMMAMGQILQGGNGGSYFNYMQQLGQAKAADARFAAQQAMAVEERDYERAQAAAELERQQAMMQAAQGGMAQYFGSQTPNPVSPFRRMDGTGDSVAADAMAYVRPELFPGLSQDVINAAARTNAPAASALIKMFYDMPDDMGQRTRAEYDDGQVTFSYNDQAAREYARETAPDYGYGFANDNPTAKFGAQNSMPTPVTPERMSQIMMNPMVPKEIKEQIMARFGPQEAPEPGFNLPTGYMLADPNNPRAGVIPIPGVTADAPERKIRNDVNGRPRYEDTGELLYPDVIPDEKSPLVEINEGGSSKYWEERDKALASQMVEIETQAGSARGALASLDVMEQLMSQPGFYSGASGESVALAKRIGQAIGLDPEGIDSMDAFNAQAKAAALDAMGGSLGTGFSNADRDFVTDQVPGLDKTPDGNRLLIAIQREIQQRKLDIEQLAIAYERENGDLRGFSQQLSEWSEANPVFSGDFVDQFKSDTDLNPMTADTPANAPPIGTEVDGYKFKGGDPSVPENWLPISGPPRG